MVPSSCYCWCISLICNFLHRNIPTWSRIEIITHCWDMQMLDFVQQLTLTAQLKEKIGSKILTFLYKQVQVPKKLPCFAESSLKLITMQSHILVSFKRSICEKRSCAGYDYSIQITNQNKQGQVVLCYMCEISIHLRAPY